MRKRKELTARYNSGVVIADYSCSTKRPNQVNPFETFTLKPEDLHLGLVSFLEKGDSSSKAIIIV